MDTGHLPPPPIPAGGIAPPPGAAAAGLPPPSGWVQPPASSPPPPPTSVAPTPDPWPDTPSVGGPPLAARDDLVVGARAGSTSVALPPSPPWHGEPDPLVGAAATSAILAPEPAVTPRRHLVLTTVLSVLLAAAVAVGAVAVLGDDDPPEITSGTPVTSPGGPNLTIDPGEGLDIISLLAKAQPSVVTIETNTTSLAGVFGGAGSGVVLTEDGLILTNAHVIEGAETITVRMFDGTSRTADLVGSFPDEDVALIQAVDAEGMVPAELGSSDSLKVGDDVVAIGNALNLGGTPSVTQGIVSALDRSIEAPGVQLDHLIQTDAAINPGNSGGPLLNAAGQVVGINTAIIDDAQNIGFALAIDAMKPLIDDLRSGAGDITGDTPRLGVTSITVADVTPAVLEEFDVATDTGAFVSDVLTDSSAADAGVEQGDVIVELDGVAITTSRDLTEAVRAHEVGDVLDMVVERAGEEMTLEVTLRGR